MVSLWAIFAQYIIYKCNGSVKLERCKAWCFGDSIVSEMINIENKIHIQHNPIYIRHK